jgi:hypothetical protein
MAIVLLMSGVGGPILGGMLADYCQRTGGVSRTMSVLITCAVVCIPAGLFSVMPHVAWASAELVMLLTIGAAISVMVTSIALVALPNELRGLCVSLKFAAGALFGLGVAPLAVSRLSLLTGGVRAGAAGSSTSAIAAWGVTLHDGAHFVRV